MSQTQLCAFRRRWNHSRDQIRASSFTRCDTQPRAQECCGQGKPHAWRHFCAWRSRSPAQVTFPGRSSRHLARPEAGPDLPPPPRRHRLARALHGRSTPHLSLTSARSPPASTRPAARTLHQAGDSADPSETGKDSQLDPASLQIAAAINEFSQALFDQPDLQPSEEAAGKILSGFSVAQALGMLLNGAEPGSASGEQLAVRQCRHASGASEALPSSCCMPPQETVYERRRPGLGGAQRPPACLQLAPSIRPAPARPLSHECRPGWGRSCRWTSSIRHSSP